MVGRKNKSMFLPYSELLTKIFVQTGYNLEKEESETRHSWIWKSTMSEIRFWIINGELISLPLKVPPRAPQQIDNVEDAYIIHIASSNNIINIIIQNWQ